MIVSLKIKQLPLRFETEQKNKQKIIELNRWNKYNIAKKIKLSPEHRLTNLIVEAIEKGVRLLKTKDIEIINLAPILRSLNIEVINES